MYCIYFIFYEWLTFTRRQKHFLSQCFLKLNLSCLILISRLAATKLMFDVDLYVVVFTKGSFNLSLNFYLK